MHKTRHGLSRNKSHIIKCYLYKITFDKSLAYGRRIKESIIQKRGILKKTGFTPTEYMKQNKIYKI